jgi:hypothetical protein
VLYRPCAQVLDTLRASEQAPNANTFALLLRLQTELVELSPMLHSKPSTPKKAVEPSRSPSAPLLPDPTRARGEPDDGKDEGSTREVVPGIGSEGTWRNDVQLPLQVAALCLSILWSVCWRAALMDWFVRSPRRV